MGLKLSKSHSGEAFYGEKQRGGVYFKTPEVSKIRAIPRKGGKTRI